MQQKCKKKALSMILSISMGLGSVASFNASNTFADTIEESTNAGNAEGDTNAGNAGGDANAGNAEGDANAGNAGGDTNVGNPEGDANAGNAGGDANAGNAEEDANAGNAEEDANAGNAEGDANAGNAEEDSNAGNAEGDMNALVVEEATAEDPTSVGDFKISGGEINVDFKFASGVLTILSGKQMTIQNNNPNTPTTHRIVIPKDVKAELIFDGVNIKTASNSPFTLTPDKDGGAYAHVILQDGSENKLESGDVYYPGMRAGKGTTLIIDDSVVNRDIEGEFIVSEGGKIPRDVTLENGDKLKKGDRLTLLDSNNRGSLKVVGNYYSAGIGGGNTESGGNIIINGGAITAIGQESSRNTGYGAGIGGGGNGSGGDITINGGTITAKGAYHGAGIGGGYYTTTKNALSPSVVDPSTGSGYSGNITINGGLSYSYGGAHGSAFGDGCVNPGTNRGYRILVTGGTILPYMTGVGDWIFDLSATTGDVIVTGGSLKATTFKSLGGAVAYGDLEKKTKVFMNKISLTYLGQDKVSTTLVDDFKMLIDGKIYPYGAPSYTDAQGILYLWFSDKFTGSEVSVNLVVIDKITGEVLKPDDFYIKDIGSGSQFLKQYEEFTIDDTPPYLIIKRYDGLPFEEDVEKSFLDWLLKDGGIPITTPKGEKLTDKKFMTISSQRLNEETMEPDINLGSDDLTKQVDAGKYQLSITSTQFSSIYPFKDAYWGHRAYYKAEIIPADTETSLVVEESKAKTDVFKPTDTFTLNVTISPDKKEGPDCASPRGYVQFYINGKEYKDPVELKTHNKGSESHNYSTASIEWRPLDSNHHIFTTEQTITVKYIGDDINYIEGSEDEKKLKLDMTNVDVDGDGIPDINIDTDGDGRPDINIDTSGDWKPDINIDTDNTGEWKPSTEGGNGDGIWKPDKNIDTNGDGNPDTDYNRPAIDTDNDGVDDYWKPDKNVDTGSGGYDTGNPNLNKPDPDNGGNSKPDSGNGGNSKPDSGNGGNSKPDSGNGGNSKPDSGNGGNSKPDPDNGGNSKPDPDNGGNGKPDPDNGGNSKPDPDNGGNSKPDPDNGGNSKPDIDTDGDGKPNINIDTDGDGKPDINIDTDGDGKPDINIDTDGDGKPDINIDIDGDGKPDINIDTDGNGKPDINIDTDESLDSNVGQNVQTGDQSNIMLDLALMFISLFFLIKNLTNKYLRRK
ncbi:collagen-binding adhesin CbpA [Clostridioides difficile]|uniref:collagen-binding adhesin CbpA n=1 Tax=Clostridioides difficile TaxID=1496 RepID=UPI00038CDF10|nr:collagen-binding adhesin CbpA [Clostridioides difficile]EII6805815.1 collagen-binding adhesin CbpA [Clostridioides difficile]EJA6381289.1 collagen-binding adhesin CbpA [Clostridioides difficile]EQE89965.1 putative serine-aspartate repeat-containing protein SdrF [Clostridioides difficile CD104]MBH6998627.1 collagen-binding adhesin CbpA [Clostridioides difficile]MBH8146819.1 collagen-binding adhesin CbpA [Clostridioides difficile]